KRNLPPETYITGGPDDGARVPHHVLILWRGADLDGTVVQTFDYIVEDYPRSITQLDQIQVQVPAPNDPRWTRINRSQNVFTMSADTLRVDPRTAPAPLEFDRWHTFFVRAVDNEGAIDETPDYRTFEVFTEAPQLAIGPPAKRGQIATLPRNCIMKWD